jgi:hypothetical protein
MLTRKLLNQEFLLVKLKLSLRKFYGRHHESFTVATMTWLTIMENPCHKIPRKCSTCRKHFPVLSSFMTYIRICNQTNTTGATSGAGTAYPSGASEFTPGFLWGSCYSVICFICMLRRLLFVLLSFFDIRILITPLVSSNSSSC